MLPIVLLAVVSTRWAGRRARARSEMVRYRGVRVLPGRLATSDYVELDVLQGGEFEGDSNASVTGRACHYLPQI